MSHTNFNWILDSGATDHICSNLELFDNYSKVAESDNTITVPDGRRIPILHVGMIILTDQIQLHNVLHVLDFHFNLISVKRLCKDLECQLVFTHDKCFLQDLLMKRSQMLLGKEDAGLYRIEAQNKQVNKVCCSAIAEAQKWHLRMGHMPFDNLKFVCPQLENFCSKSVLCQICPAAKQSRISFPDSTIKSTTIFDLVYLDVWGPYQTKTSDGCNQFLTIVDDFSRYTWVHLLKFKSEVPGILVKIAAYVQTQFQATIKCIRTDNSKEFCEGSLQKFCQDQGILHQRSCPYTP